MSVDVTYDSTDPNSIETYAKQLLNRSLRDVLDDVPEDKYQGKGKLGQMLEEFFFHYTPNAVSEPDFNEAGVELKATPLKRTSKGLVSKERLVLNIINYMEEHKKQFETSSFWTKNKLLLLMFYLYEKEKLELDYIFKIIRLWEFPDRDLKIIRDDWEKIVEKIRRGKAHEISEGDTLYLGACTKGSTKETTRPQPYSQMRAMQRAFSLKSSYLNYIIMQSLPGSEPVIKNLNAYKKGESFEDLVIRKFSRYYGMSDEELIEKLGIRKISAKQKFYIITKAILGVEGEKIEEFEKGDVEPKTIRLQRSGSLKESMSFAQIKFKEIINETWEDSFWHETLIKRFFFVIFQEDDNGDYRLKKVMFWTMPISDLLIAKKFWLDTQKKIKKGIYDNFIRISDNMICHVRPKGMDSHDLMETPQGTMEKKKCYWLNSKYILEQISS